MQFVDLNCQYIRIKSDLEYRIQKVLDHGQYVLGPEVAELEKKLADFVGVRYCITTGNGTDALLAAMMALDIKPGDEVVTTPFTFVATAEMIALLGAKPVFVDIDPKTYNIDAEKITPAITEKTKLILPVNLYGQCADFDLINKIAKKYNISVLEDAAQSLGATYKNRPSGSLATVATTSFFPSKPLGCYGDGGACFTNDELLAQKIREITNHGQNRRYHHITLGMNSRLDTLQAAVLLAKLTIFKEEITERKKIGNRYTKLLKNHCITPYIESFNSSVYAQYTIQIKKDRTLVQKKLKACSIPTAIHYPKPLHKQPVFALQYLNLKLPTSEEVAKNVISLPIHPYLKEDVQNYIVEKLLSSL